MPINASHEYFAAEKKYLDAQTNDERIFWLEEMLKLAPKHKSSENFLAELKTRLKKLREKAEKAAKKSGGKKGIRKEGYQFVIIGLPNTGKSSLLAALTNAQPKIADHPFSTVQPELGTLNVEGITAQVIDQPAIGSDLFDSGLPNNADCLIYCITDFTHIEEIAKTIPRARGSVLIAFNKRDTLSDAEKRKVEATLKSRRLQGALLSAKTDENLDALKSLMAQKTGLIRIYLKEPGKPASHIPLVLHQNATIKDVAEHILKGFSSKVKETRVTGPSSKFPNQKVGLSHVVKDRDVVEFHTK